MMKTGQQIITDVIALLRGSVLESGVSGGIYRPGTRPRDSKAEDIVVVYTTSDAGQFQSGVVTINVFVPFIPTGKDGVLVEDSARCEQVETLVGDTILSIKAGESDYKFKLKEAVHTQTDDGIKQSFVVARLGFRYID